MILWAHALFYQEKNKTKKRVLFLVLVLSLRQKYVLSFDFNIFPCQQYWTLLTSPVTSTTGCCFCFDSVSSFFLGLFLHWSPVAYWAPTNLGSSSFSVLSFLFAFSYCSWGSQGKNTEVVCHSLLQWTTFCQNSPPWPICLGWPYTAWLIVSLTYTRLWSMWSDWLVFCDCGFQTVCPLMEKGKRLMITSWWDRQTEEEIGSCSDGQSHVQWIFNPIVCEWVGLCTLSVVCPDAKLWWR